MNRKGAEAQRDKELGNRVLELPTAFFSLRFCASAVQFYSLDATYQFSDNLFPLCAVKLVINNAALAQLVEHLTRNEKVAGSNPAGGFFS